LWKRSDDYVFALAEVQVESQGENVALRAAVASSDSIEAGRWSRQFLTDGFDSRAGLPAVYDAAGVATLRRQLDLQRRVAEVCLRKLHAVAELLPEERASLEKIQESIAANREQLDRLPKPSRVYAAIPREPRPISLLARGDVERPLEPVTPGALACVTAADPEFKFGSSGEGARRAALAEWIADPRNTLTWRSIVNRVWQYHFGRGIVDTPSDFGRNGSPPTHPELLDYLALYLQDQEQSLKKLHRLIVLSSVYRQSSAERPAAAKIDADNRFLWRMNRQRLEAEAIRDAVLAVSGKLDPTSGGPGFDLFRFKDDHSPVYDHADPEKVNDPKTFRRTVYRFTVRSVQNPFLESLDCADPNINTPVRNTTLTALQALALLNDPFMVRQAEYFAERLASEGDPGKRIDLAYELAFSRAPKPAEREALLAYAARHGLPAACRLLFNTNEFVFID
jgi:hypothetical protein